METCINRCKVIQYSFYNIEREYGNLGFDSNENNTKHLIQKVIGVIISFYILDIRVRVSQNRARTIPVRPTRAFKLR